MTGAAAGWYPDPVAPGALRWWDGTQWLTATTRASTSPSITPTASPRAWNTVWIWLVTLLPILPTPLALLVPWGEVFSQLPTPSASRPTIVVPTLFLSPAYLLIGAVGWVVFGVGLWCAYRDHRALLERGVVKPFSWAFFVIGWVYPIGRSVVVHRRTGHGWAPLWVTVGAIVVNLAVSSVIVVEMAGGFLDYFARVMHSIP